MVLEHLFPENWLERKLRYAFILAFVYSTVSIVIARLLFAGNSGIVSVVFVSILLMPYLEKLLEEEEKEELREKRLTLRRFIIDNRTAIKVYGVLFLGVYLAFMFYAFLLPQIGIPADRVFQEQLTIDRTMRGEAFSSSTFIEIFLNNWWVLLACFLVALIAGDGALFFIVWNASTWGAIFGLRAVAAGDLAYGAWANLAIVLLITLPHVVLESGAYILAAISGGVLSDDVTSKRKAMGRFIYYFVASGVLFIVLHFLFRIVFSQYLLIARLLDIAAVLLLLHFLTYVFEDRRHKEVFQYNYALFLLALALFVVGALVEAVVLGNAVPLLRVYAGAMVAAMGF